MLLVTAVVLYLSHLSNFPQNTRVMAVL